MSAHASQHYSLHRIFLDGRLIEMCMPGTCVQNLVGTYRTSVLDLLIHHSQAGAECAEQNLYVSSEPETAGKASKRLGWLCAMDSCKFFSIQATLAQTHGIYEVCAAVCCMEIQMLCNSEVAPRAAHAGASGISPHCQPQMRTISIGQGGWRGSA